MELFKYVIPARIDVLQRKLIRFTQPSDFNDPWEGLPKLDALFQPETREIFFKELFLEGRQGMYEKLLERELAKLEDKQGKALDPEIKELTRREFWKRFVPEMENEISNKGDMILSLETQELKDQFSYTTFERIDELVGIFCLSEIPDNLLMWSHYAASHQGFVVGFDSTHEYFDQRRTSDDLIRKVKPVHYAQKWPSFPGFSKDPNKTEIFRVAELFLLTKADVWEYEREWRMVHTLDAADEHIGNPPSIFLYKYPPECITSVIIGCRTDDTTETLIRKNLESPNFSQVRLFKAEQDRNDYKLNIVEAG